MPPNDFETFLSLHTEDAVRVSMDRNDVRSGSTFHEKTAQSMQQRMAAGRSGTLALRFLQRSHGEDAAFERGVYRFTSTSSDHVSYGEFYVLLRRVGGRWRIALDADRSSDAGSFQAARPMEDLKWK